MKISSLVQRAKYLRISALRIAEGMKTGGFSSCFKGQGIEFDTVRDYEQGDDVRFIDWNVTARYGKPYVKLYKEERELPVLIILDNSLSMRTGGWPRLKQEQAFDTAALLSFAAEQNSSPVGLILFDTTVQKALKPKQGKDQTLTIIKTLENYYNSKPDAGSALVQAISASAQVLKSRSLVIIISDFRIAGYEKSLGFFARSHDVVAIRITSPSDYKLPTLGLLPFVDPETKTRLSLPTNSQSFRAHWEKESKEMILRWRSLCLRRTVSPLLLSTKEDAVKLLSAFFRSRKETTTTMQELEHRL